MDILRHAPAVLSAALFAAALGVTVLGFFRGLKGESPHIRTPDVPRAPGYLYPACAAWVILINALYLIIAFQVSPGAGLTEALEGIWYNTIDANNYAEIAEHWYFPVEGSELIYKIAFFPLYPVVMRLVRIITPSYVIAAVLVSSVLAFFCGVMMYKLSERELGPGAAVRSVKFMFIFPAAFFLMVPMTESLFLFLTVAFMYCLTDRRYAAAGGLAFLAAMTRSQGLLLAVPFAVELFSDFWPRRKTIGEGLSFGEIARKSAFIFGAPAGICVYLMINWQIYGDPLMFLTVQKENWHNSLTFFWNTAGYLPDYFFHYLNTGNTRFAWGMSLPNILSLWVSLLVILMGTKKLRPSLSAYALAYFAMSFGHGWLLSGPRYAVCLFVLPMTLSAYSGKKTVNAVLTVVSLALFGVYLRFFILRYGVV